MNNNMTQNHVLDKTQQSMVVGGCLNSSHDILCANNIYRGHYYPWRLPVYGIPPIHTGSFDPLRSVIRETLTDWGMIPRIENDQRDLSS